MKDNLIYGLRDPRNDIYKYIGKTTVGVGRPLTHLTKSHNSFVNEWVSELNVLGCQPHVDVIERDIQLDDLSTRESYWIAYYSDLYGELFNGGDHIYESIAEPSILSYDDIAKTWRSLLNVGEIYKRVKVQYGFSNEEIASMLNVSRKTVYHIRQGGMKTTLETIARLCFFANKTMDDFATFYISKTNEFKGAIPDTKEEFITECLNNEEFLRAWANKYFSADCQVNKLKYNKRAPRKRKAL
jgi:transcriptional regulator with XRE-family HTH domain